MAANQTEQIRQLSQELCRTRAEMKRYGELLQAIQKSILPEQLPAVPTLDLAVHFVDVDGVGGDFYDVHPIGPDHWAIVIADVVGHGLAAAALLGMVHALGSAVRGQHAQMTPGQLLLQVNQPLVSRYLAGSGQYVTAFVAQYHAPTKLLTYASAGHPYPRLVRDDSVIRLDAATGLPLGICATGNYEEASIQLLSGDRLVLITDGITESANESRELFGDTRLDSVLRTPASTAAELLQRVVNSVRTFRGGRPALDDETCLVALVNSDFDTNSKARK